MVSHKGREFKAKFIEFNWRLTNLVDSDGIGILIPNSEFAMLTVVNLTRPTTVAWYRVSLLLDTTVDEKQALAILQNAADKAVSDGYVNSTPPPTARISAVSNGRITFTTAFTLPPDRLDENATHQILSNSLAFLKIADISVISVVHQNKLIPQNTSSPPKQMEELEVLRRVRALSLLPFFFDIPSNDLMQIAQNTHIRKFSKNSNIFKEGDDAQSMFIVLEGSFQVSIEVDGKPLRVADLWPGEYFGEMSLFTGAPRSATVIAQSESIVLEIDKATVAGLFNKHPIFADTVVKVIEERLALNSKKINEKNSAVQSNAKNSVGLLASIKSFFNL